MVKTAESHLSPDESDQLYQLISSKRDVFAGPGVPLGRTSLVKDSIDTGDATLNCLISRTSE